MAAVVQGQKSVKETGRKERQLSLFVPTLRSASIPRFGLRRSEAAAAFGISEATFDKWVADRRMPRGHMIGGVLLWDIRQLGSAWDRLVQDDAQPNPFDRVVV